MDLSEKIKRALERSLRAERIKLVDDNGIIGYVVSRRFRRMEELDRQLLIDKTLRGAPGHLTPAEMRRVLAIAALTPEEYVGHDLRDDAEL